MPARRPSRSSRLSRAALAVTLAWAVVGACASDEEPFTAEQPPYGMDASLDSAGGAGPTEAGGGTAAIGHPGTCNPAFCPASFGTACCLTPHGPCGCDLGSGCMTCARPGGG